MRLHQPFYKLPFKFDVERLRQEALAFDANDWRGHPQGYDGNSAVSLISSGGGQNDSFEPPMAMTDQLKKAPYIRQVIASFGTVVGRARLMRLAPQKSVPLHFDAQYYWRNRVRVHIPIITDPEVQFHCDQDQVHMAAGESWTFDNWRWHEVRNPVNAERIHLVFDTVGTSSFWELLKQASEDVAERFVPYNPEIEQKLLFETLPIEKMLSASDIDIDFAAIEEDIRANRDNNLQQVEQLSALLIAFRRDWRSCQLLYGGSMDAVLMGLDLVRRLRAAFEPISKDLILQSNQASSDSVIRFTLASAVSKRAREEARDYVAASQTKTSTSARTTNVPELDFDMRFFDRPVFIVAAPRSGSTMLYETMARHSSLWSLGGEAHGHFEGIPELGPANRGYDSNALGPQDATKSVTQALAARFIGSLRDANGVRMLSTPQETHPSTLRLLEKTPKNALRIPFIRKIFPDARFIYLHRDTRQNISSIMEAWRSGRFVTYRNLPNWTNDPWSLALIPGWQKLNAASLAEIAATQWSVINATIMSDLQRLDRSQWCSIGYDAFLENPQREISRLERFAQIPNQQLISSDKNIGLSRYTLTPPNPNKWQKNASLIEPVLHIASDTEAEIKSLLRLEAAL